ncbi:hypothetical protein RCH10_005552, partial [Variovorax sp. GrIS 2.14]
LKHSSAQVQHGWQRKSQRNCWDGSVMERFSLNLKMVCDWQHNYANHAEAMSDIAFHFVGRV